MYINQLNADYLNKKSKVLILGPSVCKW